MYVRRAVHMFCSNCFTFIYVLSVQDIRINLFTNKGKQNNRILLYMSKCQFNKAKGQIYSEFYKQITCWISLTLRTKEISLALNNKYVLNLIRNHIIIVNNVQVQCTTLNTF